MKKTKRKGFTIVELVIVIAVIAILAAVLIPTFSNVVDKANESAALQAARTAYSQMSIAAAGAGTTVKDDVIFEKGEYYFMLNNGELVKTDASAKAGKVATTLDNGIKVYGDTAVTLGGTGVIADTDPSHDYFENNPDRLVYIEINEASDLDGRKLVIKDSDGNVVYDKNYNDQSKRFYFSMYYDFVDTNDTYFNRTNAAVQEAGDATTITTKEAAKGWYSYTFTYGTKTETGFFYYE